MAKVGRPTLIEERQIREQLQKLLPDIYKFYSETMKGSNRLLKERVAGRVLDKLAADKKPAVEEFNERLTRLEEAILKK